MKPNDKEILKLFQCDYNRTLEEDFAQVFSERSDVRLFFINEDEAFTDGKNIVVDPASNGLFADKAVLYETEKYMKIGHEISEDPWLALRMNTRAQNIHECLHLLYTTFPPYEVNDSRSTTKVRRKVLGMIDNIIEDAFIEAAGCSVYDNLESFLLFRRVSRLFSNIPSKGTVDRAFEAEDDAAPTPLPLIQYLNHMGRFLLYPMIAESEPKPEIAEYVKATQELFRKGAGTGAPKERFSFSQQIFDIIEPLIPDSETDVDTATLQKMLFGIKTHAAQSSSINSFAHEGKTVSITRLLFTNLDGSVLPVPDLKEAMQHIIAGFSFEKETALKIVLYQGVTVEWTSGEYDCAMIHKGIKIIEAKPRINLNLKKAYQNIYNKYRININAYNVRFTQLLKGVVSIREDKFLFGGGITSKRISDHKKRYWYRDIQGVGVPDIALMLLIDGSGSMAGDRRDGAMTSSVILHEVLKKQGIEHAIVEHRAIYDKPVLKHNILVDFNARDEQKYNLMTLDAGEGTREGLTLYWAEKYISTNSQAEHKLIIVLSDGVPAHGLNSDACYLPPVSIKDTANAARKIMKRGTNIIAVALDNEGDDSCYLNLKQIYSSVVSCTNLKHLTGQLLRLISREFT